MDRVFFPDNSLWGIFAVVPGVTTRRRLGRAAPTHEDTNEIMIRFCIIDYVSLLVADHLSLRPSFREMAPPEGSSYITGGT